MWGVFTVVFDGDAVLESQLPEPSESPCVARMAEKWPCAVRNDAIQRELQQQIVAYFRGERSTFVCKLAIERMTPFQKLVTLACRNVPYGKVCTYGELALRAGHAGAARAVGSVMASNPFPLLVPCHRVVGKNGIGGFSGNGGVDQKMAMLAMEGAVL